MPALLAVQVDNNVLAFAVLAIFGSMILAYFNLKKFVRDLAGIKETSKNEIGPQPFITKLAEEFVTRASFLKHAELNRQHHDKLEKEAKDQITRLETSHNNLAREVSTLGATVDVNGDRLVLMDQKLDRLIERLQA